MIYTTKPNKENADELMISTAYACGSDTFFPPVLLVQEKSCTSSSQNWNINLAVKHIWEG